MVSLSGDCSHPNGVVFDLPQTAFVMYPALFTSVEGHLRANLGHSFFKYAAPSQETRPIAATLQWRLHPPVLLQGGTIEQPPHRLEQHLDHSQT